MSTFVKKLQSISKVELKTPREKFRNTGFYPVTENTVDIGEFLLLSFFPFILIPSFLPPIFPSFFLFLISKESTTKIMHPSIYTNEYHSIWSKGVWFKWYIHQSNEAFSYEFSALTLILLLISTNLVTSQQTLSLMQDQLSLSFVSCSLLFTWCFYASSSM